MATTPERFRQSLAKGPLPPVVLIAGAEHLVVIETVDALRDRAREEGYSEREVLDVEPGFDWNRLTESVNELSLFATRRLIDLRLPTGRPGKEGAAAITAFCAAPPADTLLLVTAHDWSNRHAGAWSAAIEKAGTAVICWPIGADKLPGWIAARMASRGLHAGNDAIAVLAERVEGNLLAAAQDIDRLALLHTGGTIDAATLESLVADDARFDVFRLTDAALAGDAARALRIVDGLHAEGEEIIPLLGWLSNQLRVVERVARDPGGTASALRSEHLRPAAHDALSRAVRVAPHAHWEACLAAVGRIDRIAKGRNPDAGGRAYGDAWRELERLLVAIAQPRRSAALLAA
ncbi:MAG: DNA polymerase III subunit delta [Lysobacterales bacterium]